MVKNLPKCYSPFDGERWHQKRFMPQGERVFLFSPLRWSNKSTGRLWNIWLAMNLIQRYILRGLEHNVIVFLRGLKHHNKKAA